MSIVKRTTTAPAPLTGSFKEALAAKAARRRSALLADVSGSMDIECRNGASRLTNLREVAGKFESVQKFTFSSRTKRVEEIPPRTEGSTDLAGGLSYVKEQGITHVILLTDGEPDSEADALRAAVGLKVDIIFIGDPPMPRFLELLARQTGGSFDVEDPGEQVLLEDKIRGLLAS